MKMLEFIVRITRSFFHLTLRRSTFVCLIPGVILLLTGLSLGEKGIIPVYAGGLLIIAGYILHWRIPRYFAILAIVSLLCFPVGVLFHNVFYALNELYGQFFLFNWIFEFLHVAFFVLAVVISPAGVIIGIAGLAMSHFSNYKHSKNMNSTT